MAKIAIMGYGTVGSGVYDIIKKNADKLRSNANGESVEIKYILDEIKKDVKKINSKYTLVIRIDRPFES